MSDTRNIIIQRRNELVQLRENYRNVLLGAGYLVRNEGPVHYRVSVKDRKVDQVETCALERATLFTKEDATKVATGIVNGAGKRGEAIHIKDAIEDAIKRTDELLEVIPI